MCTETYAVGSTESAALLRDYKNHPVRSVRERHGLVIGSLLRLGITPHESASQRWSGWKFRCGSSFRR